MTLETDDLQLYLSGKLVDVVVESCSGGGGVEAGMLHCFMFAVG